MERAVAYCSDTTTITQLLVLIVCLPATATSHNNAMLGCPHVQMPTTIILYVTLK